MTPSRRAASGALLLVATLASRAPAPAQEASAPRPPARPSPVWRPVIAGAAGIFAVVFADQQLRLELWRNGGTTAAIGRSISGVSLPTAVAVGVGTLGVGLAADNRALARTGRDALVAGAAAGAAATVLKTVVGRARPNEGLGVNHFAPFSRLGSKASFPSGHTAVLFACATAVSLHSRHKAVRVAAYGAAGLVGVARVAAGSHWASDVVAGALLGSVVGRGVVRHYAGDRRAVELAPMFAAGSVGIAVQARF